MGKPDPFLRKGTLVATTERNDELRNEVKKLTADLDYAKNARKGLLSELEKLRAWKEKVTSIILHEILVD